ncbi:MAG: hypothetical protein ACLGGX_06840 [Bdellovibrionia bacterium]
MFAFIFSIALASSPANLNCQIAQDEGCKSCKAPIQVRCEQGAYSGFISGKVKPKSYMVGVTDNNNGAYHQVEVSNNNKTLSQLTSDLSKDKTVLKALADKKIKLSSKHSVELLQVSLTSDVVLFAQNDGKTEVKKDQDALNKVKRSIASEGPAVSAGGVGRAQSQPRSK